MVRARGLEPPRIAALEPKSSVSTNSTMLALLWSPLSDSNQPPMVYKTIALPNELKGRYLLTLQFGQKSLLSSSALHSVHLFIQYLACYLERVRRIELLSLGWKPKVLPLHNTRNLEEGMGFEPMERFHVRRFSKPVL